jgi:hypothetical protein
MPSKPFLDLNEGAVSHASQHTAVRSRERCGRAGMESRDLNRSFPE